MADDNNLYATLLQKASSIGHPVHNMKPMGEMPLAGSAMAKMLPTMSKVVDAGDVWKGVQKLPRVFRPQLGEEVSFDGLGDSMAELLRYKLYGKARDYLTENGEGLYQAIMKRVVPGAKFDDPKPASPYGDLQHSPSRPYIMTME